MLAALHSRQGSAGNREIIHLQLVIVKHISVWRLRGAVFQGKSIACALLPHISKIIKFGLQLFNSIWTGTRFCEYFSPPSDGFWTVASGNFERSTINTCPTGGGQILSLPLIFSIGSSKTAQLPTRNFQYLIQHKIDVLHQNLREIRLGSFKKTTF